MIPIHPQLNKTIIGRTDCLALVDDREAVFADVARDDALFLLGGGDCGDRVNLLDPLHTAFLFLGVMTQKFSYIPERIVLGCVNLFHNYCRHGYHAT